VYLTDYVAANQHGADASQPSLNLVIRARSSAQRIEMHPTSLSLHSVYKGRELHEVGRARFAVTPQRYLILNDGQRHAQSSEELTEHLAVRFRTGLGAEVYTAAAAPNERQLEQPDYRLPLEFYERTYPRDGQLSQLLGILIAFIWAEVKQDPLEQALQPIIERLLVLHRDLEAEIERQPAAKRSTREELFRRLHVARDFIEASYLEQINLHGIADVANLSPHHFLRLFKQSFQITPYQFVTKKRLELARTWLRDSDKDVTDICFDLGFDSLGTFSRSFKARFGLPPSQYRVVARAAPR
jgi:AraC family transcriptional regulator